MRDRKKEIEFRRIRPKTKAATEDLGHEIGRGAKNYNLVYIFT